MAGEDPRPEVVSQLEAALESDDSEEKDFHVRQALQLLEVEGGVGETERGGGETDRSDGETDRGDGELERSDSDPEQSDGEEN